GRAGAFERSASASPNGHYVATELEDAQGTFTLSPAPTNGFDQRIDGVVVLTAAVAVTPGSAPGMDTLTMVATGSGDARTADSRNEDAPVLESASLSAAAVATEASEQEVPAVPS